MQLWEGELEKEFIPFYLKSIFDLAMIIINVLALFHILVKQLSLGNTTFQLFFEIDYISRKPSCFINEFIPLAIKPLPHHHAIHLCFKVLGLQLHPFEKQFSSSLEVGQGRKYLYLSRFDFRDL